MAYVHIYNVRMWHSYTRWLVDENAVTNTHVQAIPVIYIDNTIRIYVHAQYELDASYNAHAFHTFQMLLYVFQTLSNSLKCLSLHEHVFVTTRVHLLHCHVNMLAVCTPGMNSFSPGDKRVVALRVTGVSNKGVW